MHFRLLNRRLAFQVLHGVSRQMRDHARGYACQRVCRLSEKRFETVFEVVGLGYKSVLICLQECGAHARLTTSISLVSLQHPDEILNGLQALLHLILQLLRFGFVRFLLSAQCLKARHTFHLFCRLVSSS
jgi:hypothetical protein